MEKLFIIIFSTTFLLFSCKDQETNNFETKLKKVVASNHPPNTIKFSALTPFEWDSVFIFTPYTPKEEILDRLGFRWNKINQMSIQYNDAINLIVFTMNNQVVKYLEYPRNKGDFNKLNSEKTFSRDEAIFELKEESHGNQNWKYFYPKQE